MNPEHFKISLDLKKSSRLLKNLDTVQLGFDLETLKESDDLFMLICQNGVTMFQTNWINELTKAYHDVIRIDGIGHSQWEDFSTNQVKKYRKQMILDCIGIYRTDNEGKLYYPAYVNLIFELAFDIQVTYRRLYRVKVYSELVNSDMVKLQLDSNTITIFQHGYLAEQINEATKDWECLSKGDFLIQVINWAKNE